jgi:glyoxylase-like metal-dependent hydrolase (beta-lactamase superfamily II)
MFVAQSAMGGEANVARRQEQETARNEVTEVAEGVLRMELPIRMPGLGHVNCYAILDANGAAVVDPGLPGPGTWRALQDRLKQAGLAPRHVHTVIVTHSHPDHFGGAGRFAKEFGAKVVAHHSFGVGVLTPAAAPEVSVDDLAAGESVADAEKESRARELASSDDPDRQAFEQLRAATTGITPWGSARPRPPWRTKLKWRVMRWLGSSVIPTVSHPVGHGDVLELAGREWFVIHTPGHTGDHFCLHDPETGVFLAGDHVLPSITPHISGISSSPDPLSSFFFSLDRVAEMSGVGQVLPAHGHPFDDLAARCYAIKRHHHERLDEVRAISRDLGPATVADFSQRLFKKRSWGAMAESETYAHLEHLRLAKDAESHRDDAGKLIYVVG